MAETLTIGIPFNLDENWMGGAYYIQNILTALTLLDESEQPWFVIITNTQESVDFLRSTGYRKMSVCTSNELLSDPNRYGIRLLFPYVINGMEKTTLTWIPDFQEQHLPYLFTQTELQQRSYFHEQCFNSAGLLLSSESAYSDLMQFYGEPRLPVFVVPFATFLPSERTGFYNVRDKYKVPARYFFCANQFWIHKNHITLLAALRELRSKGIFPHICFSGKYFDPRATEYVEYLKDFVKKSELDDQVQFLGFIPREDQVTLIEKAIAIVQPSRFEGWSTVVEDAKALNQHVIASDLDVHKEQLQRNCDFFHPSDYKTLSNLLEKYWIETPRRVLADYRKNQREFGNALLHTFKTLARANNPLINNSRSTRVNAAVSSTIFEDDLLGLSYVEGPFIELDLNSTFQWIEGTELLISRRNLSRYVGRCCDIRLSLRHRVRTEEQRDLGILIERIDFLPHIISV
jgi:glycosyltransferase involved in cell wall biosynthesis